MELLKLICSASHLSILKTRDNYFRSGQWQLRVSVSSIVVILVMVVLSKVFRYVAFSNFIARRCQSAGCTGNKLSAFLMSILDNNVYGPVVILWFMTSSTQI